MRSMLSVMMASAALLAPLAAAAQSGGDALTPPPDLGAAAVPVPPDTPTIYGGPPPSAFMAIPAPPTTCSALAGMVRRNGFVLVPTSGGNAQRYVRDERYCDGDQQTSPAWVATDDNPRCFIGYTCGESDDDGGK